MLGIRTRLSLDAFAEHFPEQYFASGLFAWNKDEQHEQNRSNMNTIILDNRPLAVDLFAGKGGWTRGLIAAGWRVIGFDIAADLTRDYPGELVIQDVQTIHGSQFRSAGLIVASPPCTEYSYMAMPWSRAKQIARALRGDGEFPEGYAGSRTVEQLNALFDACFRIQREACEAAGRHIPMVVENVRGARPWVKQPSARFGSFYLFGDVPALIPIARKVYKTVGHANIRDGHSHTRHLTNQRESDALKVPGINFHEYEKTGKPGRSFQSAAVAECGLKQRVWFNDDKRRAAIKNGGDWFGSGDNCSLMRSMSSRSNARREASALIAMIPFDLAYHIGRVYHPDNNTNF